MKYLQISQPLFTFFDKDGCSNQVLWASVMDFPISLSSWWITDTVLAIVFFNTDG